MRTRNDWPAPKAPVKGRTPHEGSTPNEDTAPDAMPSPGEGAGRGDDRAHGETTAHRMDAGEDLLEALLTASRAMVAIVARSLAGLDFDVTLPQYRALVVLASRGPLRVVDISSELGVNPSTATRMCDRLVRKGLVVRNRGTHDRREVRLILTPVGEHLVRDVSERRTRELVRLVEAMPAAWHEPVTAALRSLASATGEIPEREWWLTTQTSETSPHGADDAQAKQR